MTLLGLLDLSAAFDTVDHNILIDRLHTAFEIRRSVLSWINTFSCLRTQTDIFSSTQSTRSVLDCGVPQGSVLVPVLFLLYTADVTNIAQRHDIGAHSYTDDTQLYCHSKAVSCSSSISRMTTCIEEINQWMTSNHLAEHQTATCQDSLPDHHSERNFHPYINGSDMFGCGHRQ